MLGNYVQFRVGGKDSDRRSLPMYVVGIYEDTVLLNFDGNEGDVWEEYDKDLFGIEITEELLEEIGLEKDNDPDDDNVHNEFAYEEFSVRRNNVDFDVYIEHEDVPLCVTYLHQLQNAYHLLTGKQLEIKL